MSRLKAFAAVLAAALIGLPAAGEAAESVALQLSGPAQFEYAGYYAALWQGYYGEAGLDVTILPGVKDQAPIDPVREVAEGRAQFGVGSMQLVIGRAQGLPLLLLAPIFQQSGAAVYYRADSDFSSPAALLNARVGRLPASDILDIEFVTALRAEGIDPARLKSVTIAANQTVAALANHAIDAGVGSAWTLPWQAHELGLALKSFNPANYRVEYYGDSLFTLQHYAAVEPEMVGRFRAASLQGWEYALQHPDAVIGRLLSDAAAAPAVSDVAGFDRYQADVARRLARYPDIALGYSNPDRWTQIEAGMLGAGALQRSADLTNFVYSAGSEVPHSAGPDVAKVIAFIAAVAAALAAVTMGLPLARRALARWVRREPHAAAPPPAEPAAARVFAVRPYRLARPAPAIDLNALLRPLERRIRQRTRGKVRCRLSLFPEVWPCRTQGEAVAGMVMELVAAAAAVMPRDGSLIVGTRNFVFDEANITNFPAAQLGSFARITVRDNGPALSEAELAGIDSPATSVRPAVAKAAATMDRLGGFLRVETADGVGTAVHLYFARSGGEDAETGAASLPEHAAQVAE